MLALSFVRPGSLIVEFKVGVEESQLLQMIGEVKKMIISSPKFDHSFFGVKDLQGSNISSQKSLCWTAKQHNSCHQRTEPQKQYISYPSKFRVDTAVLNISIQSGTNTKVLKIIGTLGLLEYAIKNKLDPSLSLDINMHILLSVLLIFFILPVQRIW